MPRTDPLADFAVAPFAWERWSHPVYRKGAGPGVVVLPEVPGITPEVADFARRVVDEGFAVCVPSLFGTPGAPTTPATTARTIASVCVRREISVLASRRSSPIMPYLRALCRDMHARCGGPGVGVIGMCLTGNFALSLMVEPAVMAPVLSQPSLPFGVTPGLRAGLHCAPEDLAVARRRARDEGCTVLAMRFTADPLCTGARFERLRRELGDGVETIEIDSDRGNPHGIGRAAHSVVTTHLVDEAGHPTRAALDRVLALFRERLKEGTP